MKNYLKNNAPLILLILISFFSFTPLLRSGYFPMHDDQQAVRLLEMDKCINDLQIPCRWTPDLGYGFGYPQFSYYGPLPYYAMEVVHKVIGFGFLDSVKAGFIVGILIAALGMYKLATSMWGKWGGFLSGLIYTFVPYHAVDIYARGAMGEFWALSFLPFIFWSILEILRGNKKHILWLSLSFASLILCHNITTFIFSPAILIWILHLYSKNFKKTIYPIAGLVWGFCLSAFFVVPAFFEEKFVHIETLTQGYFNYLAHFVTIKQLLFSSYWGYGTSELGPFDNISFAVGILVWTLPILAIVLSTFLKRKECRSLLIITALGWVYLFFTHQRSTFIWNNIPLLSFVQFPWRFLGPAGFLFSLAAGSIVNFANKKNAVWLVLVITLVTILLNKSFFRPKDWIDITDSNKFSGESWNLQVTSSIFDYLPIYAKHPPTSPAPDKLIIVDGKSVSQLVARGTDWQKWSLEVSSDQAIVRLPIFDFPNWQIMVDNIKTKINHNNELGLIEFSVAAGKHDIYTVLKNTPVRIVSNIVSVLAFVLIPFFMFKYKKI